MIKYPSIETVFTRDHTTNRLNFGEIRQPEVELVCRWTVSEKIDGTNIRVIVRAEGPLEVRGRTDAAVLQPGLEDAVRELFPTAGIVRDYFEYRKGATLAPDWVVTFYGEGYGPGIQKVGRLYAPKKSFRAFDLLYGERHWADDGEMRRIASDLNVPAAPWLGHLDYIPKTREELAGIIPHSFTAYIDTDVSGQPSEGIVAKPDRVLLDARGNRVMWKLTFREFEK